jgi:hypothetical protein
MSIYARATQNYCSIEEEKGYERIPWSLVSGAMKVGLVAELRRLSRQYSDWLLTLQTALVMLMLWR